MSLVRKYGTTFVINLTKVIAVERGRLNKNLLYFTTTDKYGIMILGTGFMTTDKFIVEVSDGEAELKSIQEALEAHYKK